MLLQAASPLQTHRKGVPVLPVKDEIKKSPSEYFSLALRRTSNTVPARRQLYFGQKCNSGHSMPVYGILRLKNFLSWDNILCLCFDSWTSTVWIMHL